MSICCLTFFWVIIFLDEQLMKMEPQSQPIVTYEYLKRQNLVMLIRILASNLNCNWDALPWAQKNYAMIKQTFVRKICKSGYSAKLLIIYIN